MRRRGKGGKDRFLYRLAPKAPACWAAFIFVQGQSGTRYNPPASPVQHQRHCGRNILRPPPAPPHLNTKYHQCGTAEPILLFAPFSYASSSCSSSSLDYKCTTGKQRGWCYRATGERDKLGNRTERCSGGMACLFFFSFPSASAKRDVQAKEIKNEEGNGAGGGRGQGVYSGSTPTHRSLAGRWWGVKAPGEG